MVKVIQVFKYEYAPTKAEIREKIGTRKVIRRPILNMYKQNNVKNLEYLETKIKNLDESNEDGTLGFIDHQYFRRLEIGGGDHTYEDNWQELFFFISSKYNILIIGGGTDKERINARDVLVEYLSGGIQYLLPIYVKTQPMLQLVNKIKQEGPVEKGEYKNIMTDAIWKFPNKDLHEGAKREEHNMHRDENDPRCLSNKSTFEQNMSDSDAFDVWLAIYRCNGILNQKSNKAYELQMYENAKFVSGIDPQPHQWIIFVIQTCRRTLGIEAQRVV